MSTFSAVNRPHAEPQSSAGTASGSKTPQFRGLGLGKSSRRHRKILKDTIQGVTKSDIRRLARRGGVKRISANIYQEVRTVLRQYLEKHIRTLTLIVESREQKTVKVSDVVFSLHRMGKTIYGFGEAERGNNIF